MNDLRYLLAGTYTKGKSKGIYIYAFNQETGDFKLVHDCEVENPSYFAIVDNEYIYAVSENEHNPAYANSLRFNMKNGELSSLNKQFTLGAGPCYINVDSKNRFVVTADYAGGSVSVFRILKDGSLSERIQQIQFHGYSIDPERQKKSHIHCVKFSPDEKFLFITDLGADCIYRYNINQNDNEYLIDEDSCKIFTIEKGSGPRHLHYHPSQKYMYLINEIGGTVMCFEYDNGDLKYLQTIKIDESSKGSESAEIQITGDGRFLYASNRTVNDGIGVFSIKNNGKLEKIAYIHTGIHPRCIRITPNGKYLLSANRDSNSIEVYKINKEDGLLTNIQKNIKLETPVFVSFI